MALLAGVDHAQERCARYQFGDDLPLLLIDFRVQPMRSPAGSPGPSTWATMFAPPVPALPRRGSADSSRPSRTSSKEITPLGTVNTTRRDLGSVLVTWSSDRRSHEEVCTSATDDSARAAGTLNLAARDGRDFSWLRDTADCFLSRLARAARFKMVVVLVEVE